MTDNLLMEEVKAGRLEKLAILFERHHVMLYNFFLRLTGNRAASEDLVQEVFIRILKYRTTYRGQEKFTPWIYRIAHNAHIDFLRRNRETVPLDAQYEEAASAQPAVEDQVAQGQDAALLAKALARLPQDKQKIILLSRFQNLKYREIADLLDCPEGTIKALVHRTIKELGAIYRDLSREACRHEV